MVELRMTIQQPKKLIGKSLAVGEMKKMVRWMKMTKTKMIIKIEKR
jgi:hypothetical protein